MSNKITSPRAMPPKAVLEKLQEDIPAQTISYRKRCYSESRLRSSQKKREGLKVPNANNASNNTNENDSISTSSSLGAEDGLSHARHLSLVRRKAGRNFCLDNSIARSTKQLGRIRQELRLVNEELTHVVDYKRKLSDGSCGVSTCNTSVSSSDQCSSSVSSSSGEDEDLVFSGDLFELCRSAQQDLRMADLARRECKTILDEIETAWQWEEKDMSTRASWLRRGSEQFEKVSAEALERRLSAKSSASFEEQEEEDIDSALMKYHIYSQTGVSRHYSVPLTKRDRKNQQQQQSMGDVVTAASKMCLSV